ncbi:ATP-binding protein [Streptomyces sp. NPDC052051]|uniref:ATP-binding protein n=1 Tax=Streptomyces sp. NPDC052051 TaxID=3154649 RepID=UPI00342EFA68
MRTEQHYTQDAFVARVAFARRPDAVASARDWVREVCRMAGGTPAQVETCELLVSELVTNAVEHAAGERVEVTVWPSPLHIDVRDGSSKEPDIRGPLSDDDEHGRGLLLVSSLSSRFEVIPVEDGKICRFWIDGDGPGAALVDERPTQE